ncbi:MAG TPA: MmgE/PrpD family protein [Gemmataceae bacterium]|nr:MmgE/PrpD family protein [Gemmataceae bacterium]
MDHTLSEVLADFCSSATEASIPSGVRASARQRLLDTVGACLAAVSVDTCRAVVEYVCAEGGAAEATAIGLARRLPAAQAAFVNGVLARAVEFDDTALPAILHPSGVVIPAALAAGQIGRRSGAEVITAIALGLELCVRLGMAGYDPAVGNSLFLERGQDATAICGTLAAATVAARLLGLDAAGIAHAIGIALSFASGSLEANRSGGTVKRLQSGWAAQAGVRAAALARHGVTGPPSALEGRFGFGHCFLDGRFDAAALTAGLGTTWAVPDILFKPYPANYFTHAGIDAALALRWRGVKAEEVASMHLGAATPMVRTMGEPIDVKRQPANGYQAKFSGPYTVVAALLGGSGLGLGLDDFTDDLATDPARRALMQRVTVGVDATCEALFPRQAPAVLTVRTRDGKELVEKVLANRGSPQRPLTDEELAVKFRTNAATALPEAAIAALEAAVANIERLGDLEAVLAPTRSAGGKEGRLGNGDAADRGRIPPGSPSRPGSGPGSTAPA